MLIDKASKERSQYPSSDWFGLLFNKLPWSFYKLLLVTNLRPLESIREAECGTHGVRSLQTPNPSSEVQSLKNRICFSLFLSFNIGLSSVHRRFPSGGLPHCFFASFDFRAPSHLLTHICYVTVRTRRVFFRHISRSLTSSFVFFVRRRR